MRKIILFLIFVSLFCSCSSNKTKIHLPEYLTSQKTDEIFISPYYAINHLTNEIMNSDVDESVIPVTHATMNKIISSLDTNYYNFFKINNTSKIEFIIETNNMNNTDCYIGIKSNSNNICLENNGGVFTKVKPKYKLSDYKLTPFINIMQDEGGSHLHYIIIETKKNKVVITAYSLRQ